MKRLLRHLLKANIERMFVSMAEQGGVPWRSEHRKRWMTGCG